MRFPKFIPGVVLALVAAIVFTALLAAPATTQAQQRNTELTIAASFVRVNPDFTRPDFRFNSDTDQIGGNISLTRYFSSHPIGIRADVGMTFHSANPDDSTLLTIMAGPATKLRGYRLEPSVHALVGVARLAAANKQVSFRFDKSTTGLAYAVGGALDVRLNDRFAIRILQGEYLGTRILGKNDRHLRLGAGVVVSF